MSDKEVCRYCKRERGYACHNTRDMTDFAIDGDDHCFEQIALHEGGEAGLRYIVLNYLAKKRSRASATTDEQG